MGFVERLHLALLGLRQIGKAFVIHDGLDRYPKQDGVEAIGG